MKSHWFDPTQFYNHWFEPTRIKPESIAPEADALSTQPLEPGDIPLTWKFRCWAIVKKKLRYLHLS